MTANIPHARRPTVGKLIYSVITSHDGHMNDTDGNFGSGGPKELA